MILHIKQALCLITAVLLVLPFCGCSRDGTKGDFYQDITADPVSLDPQLVADNPGMMLVSHLFEGLVRVDSEGDIEPGVAETHSVSQDGLTYTFFLREDAQWVSRKGAVRPLTAQDFVFGLQRSFDPVTRSAGASALSSIRNGQDILDGKKAVSELGILAIDAHTLQITLDSPNPFFLQLLDTPAAMPCNQAFFEETKGRYGLSTDTLLSNGPFVLVTWKQNSRLVLSHNAGYQGEKPVLPDSVTFLVKDSSEVLPRFKSRTTDVAAVTGAEWETLDQELFSAREHENTTWVALFNLADPVFSNQKIRSAFMLSFDSTDGNQHLPPYFQPARAVVPHTVRVGKDSYRSMAGETVMPELDPAQALSLVRQGLAELGLDKLPKTAILCPDSGAHYKVLGYVQQAWQKHLKSYIDLEAVAQTDLMNLVRAGDFQIAIVPIQSVQNDPRAFLDRFTQGGSESFSRYRSAQFDAMLTSAQHAQSFAEYSRLVRQAEETLIADGVVIPLYYETSYYATTTKIQEVSFSPFGGNIFYRSALKFG